MRSFLYLFVAERGRNDQGASLFIRPQNPIPKRIMKDIYSIFFITYLIPKRIGNDI